MTPDEQTTDARNALFNNAAKGMGTRINDVDFPAPIDICEHLPLLRELASKCDHVTEFGSRWMNGSTVALLAAQPKSFVSWDIDPTAVLSNRAAVLHALRGKTSFQPRVGNTLEIVIEPTDLLFIDSLHTARQLRDELDRHLFLPNVWPPKPTVRKYIVFHDTMTFGLKGEDGSEPGLRAAIRHGQNNSFPLWNLTHDLENNNGLVVLSRCDVP